MAFSMGSAKAMAERMAEKARAAANAAAKGTREAVGSLAAEFETNMEASALGGGGGGGDSGRSSSDGGRPSTRSSGRPPRGESPDGDQYVKLPVSSAKKLRWYDDGDMAEVIAAHLREKMALSEETERLRSELENEIGKDETKRRLADDAAVAKDPDAYKDIPGYQGVPPAFVRCFPELLRAQGYYCTNNSKKDYQFREPATVWDESSGRAHWRNRAEGQPFFAVFNYDAQAVIDAFQDPSGPPVFLLSLKAGGTGLNLTQADYVIHLDPWWNPAVEQQATDRAHRIGQTRPVVSCRLVAQDTVEERILKLQDAKRDLADAALGTEGGFVKSLSADELRDLFETDR